MDSINGTNMSSLSNVSRHAVPLIYVFTPAGFTAKLALVLTMGIVGAVGFIGGSLILYFVCTRKQALYLQSSRFMKNFNLYIKSLALSDMLSALVSLPLTCIQIQVDLFQSTWACKIVRVFNISFPIITINNLIVISVEKYFSLRRVPRTLRVATVRKLIWSAWVAGFLMTLLPSATFVGVRYDLNETHYTVICKYDKDYLPFRIMFLSFTLLVYVVPSIFLVVINISLIRTMWVKVKATVSIQMDNPIKAKLRAAKIRGTVLLIAVTFAFVIPYFAYFGYVAYNMIAKPEIDFQTDFVIRYGSGTLAFCSSAINFLIYVVQMKDFRGFLKKLFCCKSSVQHAAGNNPLGAGTLGTSPKPTAMARMQPRKEICVNQRGRSKSTAM